MRKIIRCSNVGKDARYNKVTIEQLESLQKKEEMKDVDDGRLTMKEALEKLPIPKKYSFDWKILKVRMKQASDDGWPVYFHDEGDGWCGVMFHPCNGAIIYGEKIIYMSLDCFKACYSQTGLRDYVQARKHLYEQVWEKRKLQRQLQEIFG